MLMVVVTDSKFSVHRDSSNVKMVERSGSLSFLIQAANFQLNVCDT